MIHPGLDSFLENGGLAVSGGPVAIVIAEDAVEIEATLAHLARLGFAEILLLLPQGIDPAPEPGPARIHLVRFDPFAEGMPGRAVNPVIAAVPGRWIHYCYNGEFLFFPFCETRSITEMLSFHTEERRAAMLCFVVDLYAGDLDAAADGVSRAEAHFDRIGYFALGRHGPDGGRLERQFDFYGGLRWRFEEHVPPERRRIDRVALFRAGRGLQLHDDHTLSEAELNTVSCAWHHNLTAAICSFRTAKALRTNPGSAFEITGFRWGGSERFGWTSSQLMEHGLMEPGQWF